MAGEEDIRQRIIIEGTEAALAQLQQLGDKGAKEIEKIKKAGNGDFLTGITKARPDLVAFADGMGKLQEQGSRLPGIFGRISVAVQQYRLATKFAAGTTDDVGVAATKSSRGLSLFGRAIRSVGTVAKSSEVARFGEALRFVAQVAPSLALPAVAAGFGIIAFAAAKSTAAMQDAAFAANALPAAYQVATQAAVALGASTESVGKALAKFPALIKQTGQNERSAAQGAREFALQQRQAAEATNDAFRALRPLARAQRDFRDDMREAQFGADGWVVSLGEIEKKYLSGELRGEAYEKAITGAFERIQKEQKKFRDQQEDLDEQARKTNKTISDSVEAERNLAKTNRDAAITTSENATALQKLGISASQFKALDLPAQQRLVADNFSRLTDKADQSAVAIELFGEEGRRFLPALQGGAAAMKKFQDEAQAIRPKLEGVQLELADKLVTAIGKVISALAGLKDAFGLAISPTFITLLEGMAESIASARPFIIQLAQAFGSILGPILKAMGDLITIVIVPAFKLLMSFLDTVSGLLNKVFGTDIFSGIKLFAAGLLLLVGMFAPWVTVIILVVTALSLLWNALQKIDFKGIFSPVTGFIDRVKTGIDQLWKDIVATWNEGVQFIQDAWNNLIANTVALGQMLAQPFVDFWNWLKGLWNDGITFIQDKWAAFKSWIGSWVTSIVSFFQPLLDIIKKVGKFLGFSGGGEAAGTAPTPAFAGGGSVRGKGTGTSDSILARLSNGEFVMKMKAVRKYGLGFMNAINSGALSLNKLRGFNLGGYVSDKMSGMYHPGMPRFAEGGLAEANGGMRPVEINFEGTRVDAMMAEDAINLLSKKSIRARANRAGRSPSWVR